MPHGAPPKGAPRIPLPTQRGRADEALRHAASSIVRARDPATGARCATGVGVAIPDIARDRLLRPHHLRAVPPGRAAMRCRKKFLRYFADGFTDETYVDWERGYKWTAHERWQALLGERKLRDLLRAGDHREIARRAITIESRTNLLFSFEKMALRDAVKTARGAKAFAEGLAAFLAPHGDFSARFERWCDVVAHLPRVKTRVLTWPIVTVFGFLARPSEHVFLKPNVTRRAAKAYDFAFEYASRPSWPTYESLLSFAATVRRDVADLQPRDMIDVQSFLWVQGSDEYP